MSRDRKIECGRKRTIPVIFSLVTVLAAVLMFSGCGKQETKPAAAETSKEPVSMSLQEYLDTGGEVWFLSGKKKYPVQAMMVSKETSFSNELEVVDYTVTDDGVTVILKGTADEMWTSDISRVMTTYTKPDGSPVTQEDFQEKDVWVDLCSIPSPDTNYAMHVPNHISVTVETAWGNVLHTNLPNAPHGDGDYLVCRAGEDAKPDLSDVWVLNGVVFPNTYDTSHMPSGTEAANAPG